MDARPAPPWSVSRWFNADAPSLESLRGRPVFLHAFQMLCPACVQHAVAQRGHLQVGRNGFVHAAQVPRGFELGDEVAQVGVGHGGSEKGGLC